MSVLSSVIGRQCSVSLSISAHDGHDAHEGHAGLAGVEHRREHLRAAAGACLEAPADDTTMLALLTVGKDALQMLAPMLDSGKTGMFFMRVMPVMSAIENDTRTASYDELKTLIERFCDGHQRRPVLVPPGPPPHGRGLRPP